jgi:adenylyl- and sulfurtransferase ThiI
MNEAAFVVVFPSIFAKNKQNQLITNIKKILKIQNQHFGQLRKDDGLIVIDANDPVFASPAINLLFGIDKITISRRTENRFDLLVSSIAKIGANLLLKGDQFHIKVEGHSSGYLRKLTIWTAGLEQRKNMTSRSTAFLQKRTPTFRSF